LKNRISNFFEVFVDCPVEVLSSRDVKGLYKKALAGEIPQFTGISDPYEAPVNPDLLIRSDQESVEKSVERVWAMLKDRELI
jgi:adenylylsulfate kinase-like enzyme